MRATRRRQRRPDPLASPDSVRVIFAQLRAALPDLIPARDKDLVRMLRAVRHIQRYTASDTRSGRPPRWPREQLLSVGARLTDILERETPTHISLASFVDHYLRLLDFPTEIVEALTRTDINLFEAEQLARITPERLGLTPAQARRTRADLLSTHLQTKASGERLRRRINELLRTANAEANTTNLEDSPITDSPEDFEDFDPYDSTHLFWEQIKQLGFAFREIRREDVTDQEIEELLEASEPIMAVLARIQRRKEQLKTIKI